MADKKSVISQLQTVGEEALGKIASNDVGRQALQGAMKVKERAEKTLRGFDDVEGRLEAIEKRLTALEGKKGSTSSSTRAAGGSGSSASKSKSDS